jgi:hypothetical protein
MAQPLTEGIHNMRAAVLARLAERCDLYFDREAIQRAVSSLNDAEVWALLESNNAGMKGYLRRASIRLRRWWNR